MHGFKVIGFPDLYFTGLAAIARDHFYRDLFRPHQSRLVCSWSLLPLKEAHTRGAVFDNILQNKGMVIGQAEEPNDQAVQGRQDSQQSLYILYMANH
eukprot:s5085_g2.t1